MTRAIVIAAALALLAGCNPAADAPEANRADKAANVPSGEAPAPTAALSANAAAGNGSATAAEIRTESAIPAAFHGEWNADLAVCESGLNDARMRVASRSLRFFESAADVRRVEIQDARTITVDADFQGEGESWTRRVQLVLSPDGQALTMDGLTRQRCP